MGSTRGIVKSAKHDWGMRMGVAARFDKLLDNLTLTSDQLANGNDRRDRTVQVLNTEYYSSSNMTDHSLFVGSWGKHTRIRPPRDVDILFILPYSVYERFERRSGNKQSQLLQEIRTVLSNTFTTTTIRGDGPVVVVPFSAYNVEVIPAFSAVNGRYAVCMTDNGGYYKTADYNAELESIKTSNDSTKNNTRHLVRMMKCWQAFCSVPIKSFWIELTAMDFLRQWAYAGNSSIYYDWIVRDYLKYLCDHANTYVYAPGTGEQMALGNAWESRAKSARDRAIKACEYEANNSDSAAGEEWQKIFGTEIPRTT